MAEGQERRAVLFDVDGTLVDTVYLHTVTWWEAMRQYGHQASMARIQRAIGMGGDHLLDHVLGEDRDRSDDDGVKAAHTALYAQYWTRLVPFPGAADLLRACAGRGWTVVLASSASAREFEVMKGALDADDVVDAATGADDVESSKPAPDLVEQALELAGVEAGQAVFVGDSVWDGESAARAGVPFVGLESGGFHRQELLDAGARAVYRDPADLLAGLSDSPLA